MLHCSFALLLSLGNDQSNNYWALYEFAALLLVSYHLNCENKQACYLTHIPTFTL